MKKAVLLLFLFLPGKSLISQTTDFAKAEAALIREFQDYRNADYEIRFDSLRQNLRARVENLLSRPESFDHDFDSLSKHISLIKSGDGKVRIFSWDELTGGTWHDMAVMVQFKTSEEEIKTQWIDSDISEEPTGMTSAIQYEVNTLEINGKTHYLCFGWGTYGSGHHHHSILVFSIENDSLKVCSNCIEEKHSFIQAPRSEKIDLKYNKPEKTISFNEFKYDEESGFSKATGQVVLLKLKNGKFVKVR